MVQGAISESQIHSRGTENASSIHAFNRFGHEGHVELFQCHFRVVDYARDALDAFGTPTIHD